MKRQSAKSRGKYQVARKPMPRTALTRLVVLDALRTWVIPTVAVIAGFVIFVLYNIDLVDENVGVIIVGVLALSVALFFSIRGFLGETVSARLAALLIVYALLWGAATVYPFYRTVRPGTPLFTTELSRGGTPVVVPLRGKPGHYTMTVEGHFLPAEGHVDRTANYSITVGHDGGAERVLQGTFSQQWGSQRVGAGRRSIPITVMHQTTQHLDRIDDPDGHDLTVRLTDLSPGLHDGVTLRVYAEGLTQPMLIALAILTIAGALVIDSWRPKGASEGLLTTLTVATFVSTVAFRTFGAAPPGFPQLVVAVLAGTLFGWLGASLLWWLMRPIRKYFPTRP